MPDHVVLHLSDLYFHSDEHKLHTICESGNCPNMGECWGSGTATFMILGNVCTRSCSFCAVATGRPPEYDIDEPSRVAEAIHLMRVKHAVITSVNRDELKDRGAEIWYQTVTETKKLSPKTTIETLIPFEDKAGRKIPVIAAGGVYSGADIEKLLRSGAGGVQMATRFVATHECDAHSDFKEMFINAGKNDLMIIDSPVGLPGRAIRNKFLKRIETGGKAKFTCPWKCLRTCDFHTAPYCIGKALVEAQLGRLENGFAFAGANVWRVNEIVSVKELMEMLIAEYKEAACRHESYICREA